MVILLMMTQVKVVSLVILFTYRFRWTEELADVISMATMGDFTHLFEASIGLDHQATNKMGIRSNTMRIDGEIMIDAGLLMPHLRTAKIVEYIYIYYIYIYYIYKYTIYI